MGELDKAKEKLAAMRKERDEVVSQIDKLSTKKRDLESGISLIESILPPPTLGNILYDLNRQSLTEPPSFHPITTREFRGKPLFEVMKILLGRNAAPTLLDDLANLALHGGYEGSDGDIKKMKANMSSLVSRDERDNANQSTFLRAGRGQIMIRIPPTVAS